MSIFQEIFVWLLCLFMTCAPEGKPTSEGLQQAQAGYQAQLQGKYDEAIRLYDSAVAVGGMSDRELGQTYNYRGVSKLALGDLPGARADLDLAVQAYQGEAEIHSNSGWIYHQMKHFDEAIASYDEALRVNGKYAIAYANRGLAHSETGDYNQALRDYDRAIELNPKGYGPYIWRAAVHLQNHNYETAIKDYDQAIALNPNLVVAYNDRAAAHIELDQLERARSDLTTALRLNPGFAMAHNNLCEIDRREQKLDDALVACNRAIELGEVARAGKFQAVFYLTRAQAHEALNQIDLAIADVKAAREIWPEHDSVKEMAQRLGVAAP